MRTKSLAKLRGFRWLLLTLSGCFAMPLLAANSAVSQTVTQAGIEAVQMPAWLVRAGRVQPLAVGVEVKNGDRIRTGGAARVYVKLAEGSIVKLGENAELGFYSRSLKPASSFKGALDVVKGAFRLTTGALQKVRGQREIDVRVGTATAGIRGTDLWGKSDAERDLILLIEGRIEIKHAGKTLEMTEPLTYFAAPKGAPPQPVTPLDPEQFKLWARETEILPGDGTARRNGKWRVLLVQATTQQEALLAYDAARGAGYAVQVRVLPAGAAGSGQWNYQVVLPQLVSEQEAMVVAQKIKRQLGFAAVPEK